jgi:hypothetical protein
MAARDDDRGDRHDDNYSPVTPSAGGMTTEKTK